MAWKGRPEVQPDFDALEALLVNSKLQTSNNALYQTIKGLIQNTRKLQTNTDKSFESIKGEISKDFSFPTILSGYYLPTLTNIANLDSSDAYYCRFLRIGAIVFISGKFNLDPIFTGTVTTLELTLPFPTGFAHLEQCSGVIGSPEIEGAGAITAWPPTGNIRAELISMTAVLTPYYFTCGYEIGASI